MKYHLLILFVFTVITVNCQELKYDLAKTEFESGNYSSVINIVNQEISKNSLHDSVIIELMHLKARSFALIQNHDSSFYTLVDIYNRFPKDFHALLQLGYLYGESGDFKTAFFFFQNIRKYYPNELSAVNNLSFYNNEAGDYHLGLAYADTTLQMASDSLSIGAAWNNRCFSNIMLGNYSDAKRDLAKALIYYPNNSYAYKNKGLILIVEGEIEQACEAFERAKDLGGVYITEELRKEYCNK